MKKIILLISIILFNTCLVFGQVTNFGTGSGTSGSGSSFFGYNSGTSTLSATLGNSFFGHYSGHATTSGYNNTASGFNSMRYNTTGFANSHTVTWRFITIRRAPLIQQ